MRYAFWRLLARVLDLGMLTVRPSWTEIKYKINGRVHQARQGAEFKRQQKTVEFQQYQTWRAHWMARQAESNKKRERKNAVRIRLDALLSRP